MGNIDDKPCPGALFIPLLEHSYEGSWSPSVDILRGEKGWLLKLELAGVRPEEIELRVERGRLRVSGVRRDFDAGHYVVYERLEIGYLPFERDIPLEGLDPSARITLEYRDGILFLYVEESSHAAL